MKDQGIEMPLPALVSLKPTLVSVSRVNQGPAFWCSGLNHRLQCRHPLPIQLPANDSLHVLISHTGAGSHTSCSLLIAPSRAAEDGPSTRAPDTYLGDLEGLPGSRLRPGPATAVGAT